MKNKKPLRRYNNIVYVVFKTKYYLLMKLYRPLIVAIIGLPLICSIVLLVVGIILFQLYTRVATGSYQYQDLALPFFVVFFLVFFILAGADYFLFRIMFNTIKNPVNSFLNPPPPEPNKILSDKEVLVRASSSQIASDILLRAAVSQPNDAPETLLRATNARSPE